MIRLWEKIKVWFFFYDLKPEEYVNDQYRDKYDLLNDVRQKRVLVYNLYRKFRQAFALAVAMPVLFTGYLVFENNLSPEKKTLNRYIEDYSTRLEEFAETGTSAAINDAEILIALSHIKDGEYNDAVLLLSTIPGEEAEWLKALCYLQLKNDFAARVTLMKIVAAKGKFSLAAEEILEKHKQ